MSAQDGDGRRLVSFYARGGRAKRGVKNIAADTVHQHEDQEHNGKRSKLRLKRGGKTKKMAGGGVPDPMENRLTTGIVRRPTRTRRAMPAVGMGALGAIR